MRKRRERAGTLRTQGPASLFKSISSYMIKLEPSDNADIPKAQVKSEPIFAVPSAPALRRKRNVENMQQPDVPTLVTPKIEHKNTAGVHLENDDHIKTEGESHIIFIIDNSKSMKKSDVANGNKTFITRTKAVQDCCVQFVTQQLRVKQAADDKYSVMFFNNKIHTPMHLQPLSAALPSRVHDLWKNFVPHHQTNYLTALNHLPTLIDSAPTLQPYVIFLTDGVAGDSPTQIIAKFTEIIQKYESKWGKAGLRFTAIGFGGKSDMIRAQKLLQAMCEISHGELNLADLQEHKLQETFSQVSTSLTTTRATRSEVLPKIGVRLEPASSYKSNFGWGQYSAQRLTYDNERDKFVNAPGPNLVTIRRQPFAQGGVRYAYHMMADGVHYVAKESKSLEKYKDRLNFHRGFFMSEQKATELAAKFNKAAAEITSTTIEFLPCEIYRLNDPMEKGSFRYLSCEQYLEGKYVKFNGNNGYVNTLEKENVPPAKKIKTENISNENITTTFSYNNTAINFKKENNNNNIISSNNNITNDNNSNNTKDNDGDNNSGNKTNDETAALEMAVPQAFSHFTYEHTKHQEVVCDIQGVGFRYTDPTILSISESFGHGDLGPKGIETFMSAHTCNYICHELGLKVYVVKK